jgi:phage portal protein BeeE
VGLGPLPALLPKFSGQIFWRLCMNSHAVSSRTRAAGWLRRFIMRGSKSSARKSSFYNGAALRSYMVMPGQPVWMDRDYSQFAEEAYIRNVIAHRAMDMVASAVASVRIKLYSTNNRGQRRELKTHPALELLKKPNPSQGSGDFFRALYHYRMISGNAFVQAVGPQDTAPKELYLLRPDRVTVIAGKGTTPAGYRYTVGERNADFPVDR